MRIWQGTGIDMPLAVLRGAGIDEMVFTGEASVRGRWWPEWYKRAALNSSAYKKNLNLDPRPPEEKHYLG